jgi:hypothetical protein
MAVVLVDLVAAETAAHLVTAAVRSLMAQVARQILAAVAAAPTLNHRWLDPVDPEL